MGWSKLDHEFFRNPKVIDLPGPAKLVYLAALCHSGEQLTDGFVSKGASTTTPPGSPRPNKSKPNAKPPPTEFNVSVTSHVTALHHLLPTPLHPPLVTQP
jgi:hypothetical protein